MPNSIEAEYTQRTLISPDQRGLWLISALDSGTAAYNLFGRAWMYGPLDVPALHSAIRQVIARHEVLRIAIPARQGAPDPVIRAEVEVALPIYDLSGEAAEEIERVTCQWCEQPFELASDVLLRVGLFRLGENRHIICVSTHHIVSDGQSLQIFFDELAQLYPAGAALEPLPAQYAHYARWQLDRANRPEALDWWAGYLRDAPDVLTLPADRPRPAVRSFGGATMTSGLPADLIARVSQLGRRLRMSPFMVLLAGFGLLLCRLAATREVVLGVPVSDRGEPEFEPLIGLFVKILPVRISITDTQSFEELLRQVRGSMLQVLAHQDVSFDRLVERIRPRRSPAHTPLVQCVFSADLLPLPGPRFAGLETRVLVPQPTTAKFDLDVSINGPAGPAEEYSAVFTYSTDLFDAATVERFAQRYRRLLEALVADPGRSPATAPLLAPGERAQILDRWSIGAPGHLAAQPVHEMFAEQAGQRPDAPAVRTSSGTEYSYAEVNARADRIAAGLRKRGVGPDQVVGVLQYRGLDLVTTLLAVLKAGAAYLPLSPTHPAGYLAKVICSAGARYVITEPALRHRLDRADAEALTVAELAAEEGGIEPVRLHPLNLAYVLYTSGSTGEPKGVAVSHQAVSNHVLGMRAVYQLTAADRVLQFANIGFDIAVEELFPTWSVGACVVLTDDPPPNPDRMAAYLAEHQVSFFTLTSSYWRQWSSAAAAAGVHPGRYLRRIVVGAEPVDIGTLRSWQRQVGLPIFNCYGLTETTVNATFAELGDASDSDVVPAGRPVDGATAYVLDRNLELVPPGVEGELYIGGECLARCYLGRPGLTAERFVPHPFVAGARLHRTGDRARWLADGNLEILGRMDDQLKVRGYRVEPGHVESVLCEHPGVQAAVVAVRNDQLVGYVVSRDGLDVPADLRNYLADHLPTYLVPAALLAIPRIPLNGNGKVDLAALPAPMTSGPTRIPASTELERRIAEVWQQTLGCTQVGVHDNFFELGGTSMALATVHARLSEMLGRRLPLVALYEHPTIAGLAQHLTHAADPAEQHDDDRAMQLRVGRSRLSGRRGRR